MRCQAVATVCVCAGTAHTSHFTRTESWFASGVSGSCTHDGWNQNDTVFKFKFKCTRQNTGRRGGGGAADDARHVAHGELWSQAGYQSVVDAFMEALPHSHLTFLDIGYASTRDPVQRSPQR